MNQFNQFVFFASFFFILFSIFFPHSIDTCLYTNHDPDERVRVHFCSKSFSNVSVSWATGGGGEKRRGAERTAKIFSECAIIPTPVPGMVFIQDTEDEISALAFRLASFFSGNLQDNDFIPVLPHPPPAEGGTMILIRILKTLKSKFLRWHSAWLRSFPRICTIFNKFLPMVFIPPVPR